MLFLSLTAGDTSRPGTAEYADFDEQIDAAAAAAEAKEAELQDLRRQVEDKKAFILEFLATADDATRQPAHQQLALLQHASARAQSEFEALTAQHEALRMERVRGTAKISDIFQMLERMEGKLTAAFATMDARVQRIESWVNKQIRRDDAIEREIEQDRAFEAAFQTTVGRIKDSARGFAQSVDGVLSQRSNGDCAVAGSVALSTETPSYWSLEVLVRGGDYVMCGITLDAAPPPQCGAAKGTFAWFADAAVRVAGAAADGRDGWAGFDAGDVLTFKFDPRRRWLTLHLAPSSAGAAGGGASGANDAERAGRAARLRNRVFRMTAVSAGLAYVLVDLAYSTTRVRMRPATTAEKLLVDNNEL